MKTNQSKQTKKIVSQLINQLILISKLDSNIEVVWALERMEVNKELKNASDKIRNEIINSKNK